MMESAAIEVSGTVSGQWRTRQKLDWSSRSTTTMAAAADRAMHSRCVEQALVAARAARHRAVDGRAAAGARGLRLARKPKWRMRTKPAAARAGGTGAGTRRP